MTVTYLNITNRKKHGNLNVYEFTVGINSVTEIYIDAPVNSNSPSFSIRYSDGSIETYIGLKFMFVTK